MANFLLISVAVLFVVHVVGVALLLRNQRWLRWPPHQRLPAARRYAITVIVPARNEEADIGACLRSLAAQENVELRIIAVNDHSEDQTGRRRHHESGPPHGYDRGALAAGRIPLILVREFGRIASLSRRDFICDLFGRALR